MADQIANGESGLSVRNKINAAFTDLDGKAPIASPAFTGNPTAPTQTTGDNSTKIATTAFVAAAALSGPQGPQGPAGPTGPAGADGGLNIKVFDTAADLLADSSFSYTASDDANLATSGDVVFAPASNASYVVAASDATDQHLTTAGGVKLYLQPGLDGRYNAQGLGAVADGADNFDGFTHGENKLTRAKLASWKWITGQSYAVGDVVEDTAGNRGLVCLVAHIAGTLADDVAAGRWETGSMTGTDNSAVMDLCIEKFHENGLPVFWPVGKYRFADPGFATVGGGQAKHNLSNCDNVFMYGEQGTEFLLDEDATRLATGGGGSFFLDTRQQASPFTRTTHNKCIVEGITFRGRWSHYPGGDSADPNSIGWTPIRVEGFRYTSQSGCSFIDIRNKGNRNAHNNMAHHRNVYGERCARGVLREVNSNHVVFEGCTAKHTDDDPFDANLTDDNSTQAMHTTQMLGLVVEDCESIISNNGHSVTIMGVISQRSKGGVMSIARAGSASPGSGRGPKTGIRISQITAFDPMERYVFNPASADDEQLASTNAFSGAINIAGNKRDTTDFQDWAAGQAVTADDARRSTTDGQWYTADASGTTAGDDTDLDGGSDTGVDWTAAPALTWPGDWDASASNIRAPWDRPTGAAYASYMWNPQGATGVQANGLGIHISDVQLIKSTPNVANYSDLGHGYMFTRRGWKNPAVSDNRRKGSGLAIQGEITDLTVDNLYVHGFIAGVSFAVGNNIRYQTAFQNIRINGLVAVGQTENCVIFEDPGEAVTWDVTFNNCNFDLDRYHRNTRRAGTADGAWLSGGGNIVTGAAINKPENISGVSVVNCDFRNCLTPLSDGSNNVPFGLIHAEGNRLHCEFAVTGGAHSSSNKGIGKMPAPGPGWSFIPTRSDPSATSTFGRVMNYCLTSSDGQPSSGLYPKGHICFDNEPNTGTTTTGGDVRSAFLRLTDGTGHVTNTDWARI